MKQIIYVMQFQGQAAPSSENPNVLNASTTAPGCNIRTVVDTEGVSGNIEQNGGGTAAFESEVTLTGGTGFQESGTITFGDGGHRLHFSTVGEGYLNASADERLKHGAVTWKIDRGEGQLEGATGLITSNFTVSGTGEVTDNHFGVIFLK
ncbi:MAG: hypothetical protein LC747_05585 [Acidobacteria bacterium]|nr:hypothetical protein [Acidobacteriota bacterium]